MSEKLLTPPPEMHEQLLEAHASPEKSQKAEKVGEASHESYEESKADRLSEIRNSIQESAGSSREGKQALASTHTRTQSPLYVDKRMKAQSLKHELKAVRKQLPKSEQVLSRVVHLKPVQAASELGEKTIARPQALLWGGLCAALSSAALYLTAKYIGFQYNYLLGILFFVGGYFIGLLVELTYRLTHKPSPDNV
jgi:hypothetical protein